MKRKIVILTLLASFLAGGYAAAAGKYKTIRVFVDQIAIKLNGGIYDSRTEALVYNGTVYLPIRDIGEELGGTVEWNSADRSVSINFERQLAEQFATQSRFSLYRYMMIEKNQVMLNMIKQVDKSDFKGMEKEILRLQALEKLAKGVGDTVLEKILSQMAFSAEVIRSGTQSKKGDDFDFAVGVFTQKESEFNSHVSNRMIELTKVLAAAGG